MIHRYVSIGVFHRYVRRPPGGPGPGPGAPSEQRKPWNKPYVVSCSGLGRGRPPQAHDMPLVCGACAAPPSDRSMGNPKHIPRCPLPPPPRPPRRKHTGIPRNSLNGHMLFFLRDWVRGCTGRPATPKQTKHKTPKPHKQILKTHKQLTTTSKSLNKRKEMHNNTIY